MVDATGLSTPEVTRLTGVPASTITSWSNDGLVGEPILPSLGLQRATRYWSLEDVVIIRAVRALRTAGCPLAVVKRVAQVIQQEWNSTLAGAVLVWDGHDLLTVTPEGEIMNVGSQLGQGAFEVAVHQTVVCPIGTWARQAAGRAEQQRPLDLGTAKQRREVIAETRARRA